MRGAPAPAVQKLAGHRDLGTTQRYMHLSPLAIEAAIRLLELPPSAAERGNMRAPPEAREGRWTKEKGQVVSRWESCPKSEVEDRSLSA